METLPALLKAAGIARLDIIPVATPTGTEYDTHGYRADGTPCFCLLGFMDYCDAARYPDTLRRRLKEAVQQPRTKAPRFPYVGKLSGLLSAARARLTPLSAAA